MDLIAVVISGLAGWRIASLFHSEAGPWDVFEKFRKFIGIKPGPIEGFFPLLFTCIYCLGFWCALGAYLVWLVEPMVVIPFAASTIVITVDKVNRE